MGRIRKTLKGSFEAAKKKKRLTNTDLDKVDKVTYSDGGDTAPPF